MQFMRRVCLWLLFVADESAVLHKVQHPAGLCLHQIGCGPFPFPLSFATLCMHASVCAADVPTLPLAHAHHHLLPADRVSKDKALASTDSEATVVGNGPHYTAFFWKRLCYRVNDFVSIVGSSEIFRIERIMLFRQLQDGMVWFDARPHYVLDEDDRLLGAWDGLAVTYPACATAILCAHAHAHTHAHTRSHAHTMPRYLLLCRPASSLPRAFEL